jgi:hypothetical protein
MHPLDGSMRLVRSAPFDSKPRVIFYLSLTCSLRVSVIWLYLAVIKGLSFELNATSRAVEFLSSAKNYADVFSSRETYIRYVSVATSTCRPGDVWEELCDYASIHNAADEEAFRQTSAKRHFTISSDVPTPWDVQNKQRIEEQKPLDAPPPACSSDRLRHS